MGGGGDLRAPRLRARRSGRGELQRSDARTQLVAGYEVSRRRFAVLRTLREMEIPVAARSAPRGRRIGRWRRSARGPGCSALRLYGALSKMLSNVQFFWEVTLMCNYRRRKTVTEKNEKTTGTLTVASGGALACVQKAARS